MLYDENKKMFLSLPILKVGEGSTGTVYRLSKDRCVKIYNEPLNKNFTLEIKKIRRLKLSNFYEIYDLLYNKKGELAGYIMKYYKKDDINLLTTSTDYLLDNYTTLLKSFNTLAQNNIRAYDLYCYNSIINSNGVYIIDIDDYYYEKATPKYIICEENTERVVKLFHDLTAQSILKYFDEPCMQMGKYLEENKNLFSIDNLLYADSISKKLVKYKYPIDYFKAKVR